MDNLNIEACLDAIERTFEMEAEHIVRGQLVELGALAKDKVEQLSTLSNAIERGALQGQPNAVVDRVRKLQMTATEHDRHLLAMRHGLSRLLERMGRLQSDANVGSYNRYGAKVQFSNARGGFESKA